MTAPAPTAPATGFEFLGLRGWSRKDAVISTPSLAQDATSTGTVALAPGWRLYKVQADQAARIRLYASTAQRTQDLGRPIGTDPDLESDHGLFLEFVTTGTLLQAVLSPQVHGYCPSGVSVPYAITNLDPATGPVVVTLTYVRTE